jgi:hypothetical protein
MENKSNSLVYEGSKFKKEEHVMYVDSDRAMAAVNI